MATRRRATSRARKPGWGTKSKPMVAKRRRRRSRGKSTKHTTISFSLLSFHGAGRARRRGGKWFRALFKGLRGAGRRAMPQPGCLARPGSTVPIRTAAKRTGGPTQGPRANRYPGSDRTVAHTPGLELEGDSDLGTTPEIPHWTERGGVPANRCECGGLDRHAADCEVWR